MAADATIPVVVITDPLLNIIRTFFGLIIVLFAISTTLLVCRLHIRAKSAVGLQVDDMVIIVAAVWLFFLDYNKRCPSKTPRCS